MVIVIICFGVFLLGVVIAVFINCRQFDRIVPAQRHEEEVDEEVDEAVLQAEIDRDYLIGQLEQLEDLYREARIKRDKARRDCKWDEEQMAIASGSAITNKAVELHKKERDKYTKLCLKYESQIHAHQKRLAKAESIINGF